MPTKSQWAIQPDYRYGNVTDFSIKNNMNNSATRGWTWGVSGVAPVMSVNTQGRLHVANVVTTHNALIANEDGLNVDSRIESDGNPNMFRV